MADFNSTVFASEWSSRKTAKVLDKITAGAMWEIQTSQDGHSDVTNKPLRPKSFLLLMLGTNNAR